MAEVSKFDNILDAWSKFHEQCYDNWLDAAQKATNIAMEQFFENPSKLVEELVNCGLKVQSEYVRGYAKNLERRVGNSLPVSAWAEQGMIASRMWTNAQSQVWNTWVSAVKAMEP